jgi:hypothetical protein
MCTERYDSVSPAWISAICAASTGFATASATAFRYWKGVRNRRRNEEIQRTRSALEYILSEVREQKRTRVINPEAFENVSLKVRELYFEWLEHGSSPTREKLCTAIRYELSQLAPVGP